MAQAPSTKPAETDRGAAYYHYSLSRMYGELASANGRQDYATQAIEEYKLALGADPNSRMLQDGLPDLYFMLGRIREAVSAAQEQVTKHSDDVNAHQLLGKVYLRSLGDMQGPQSNQMLQLALKEYETIAKLKPNDLETRLLLGQLYGLNHDSAKAESEFKEAQRIDGSSEEVVLNMARLYTEQGQMEKAVSTLTSVPEDDRSARMEFALAGIYDTLKKPKEAAEAYKRSLALEPDNADAKRGLANALINDGKVDAAGKVYNELVQSDPQDAQSLIRAADIQRREGHYEEALATLKKAKAIVTDTNPELSYNEALTYDALGRYEEATSTLKAVLAATEHADGKYNDGETTNRGIFLDRLAIIYREQAKTAESVAAYKQLGQLGGDYVQRAAEGEVDSYRDAHQWASANAAAATAAKILPKNHEVQLLYARQLADAGKLDEAIKLAEKQLNGTPEDRDVYYTAADIEVRARRWKEASAQLDKAEALASKADDKVFLYYYRGTVAERQKMFDQAEIEFRKALAIDPQNAAVQNYLGYMLADRGVKLPEAIEMLRKVVAFDPQNGAYLDSLGWAYFKAGQYALAEENLRKAAARTGSDPTVLDHLGEVYERTGKLRQAVQEWQKSLTQYATSLPPEADPVDVAHVEHKLEGARVKLAHVSPAK
jgi:tetratricopeptide (TPR) repeat protein